MKLTRTLTFGELLRQHRRAAQLSQEALAERAELSRRGVSDLERGLKLAPRVDTVDRLAAALNLTPVERDALTVAARARRSLSEALDTGSPAIRAGSIPLLVGRTRELALVERSIAGEGPAVLLLAGEPGIGKSRLLAEASARARLAGWRVVDGGCQRRSGQEPYEPFASMLAREVVATPPARRRVELARCAWLPRLVPELAAAGIAPVPPSHLQPEQERRMLFGAVRRYLANIAGPSGTLLVLDDLQWAGADALELLAALVDKADDSGMPRLRVVGAYCETELRPQDDLALLLAELARDALVDRHVVDPLREQDAAKLLTGLLGDAAQGSERADLYERIVNQTGGIPYYLVCYARELLARGEESGQEGAAHGAGEAVPWSVAHSIRVRLAALSEKVQAVLEVAAVVGRVTPIWLLVSAAGGEEAEVVHAVELARAAGVLAERDHAYQFRHDLIRNVLLADLGSARSREIHRRVAQALINRPDGLRERHAAEITYHLLAAEERMAALPYALDAGARAMHVFAYGEAERYYRLAAALAQTYSDRRGECEALEQLARVLRLRERTDEALAIRDQMGEAPYRPHLHHVLDELAEGELAVGD